MHCLFSIFHLLSLITSGCTSGHWLNVSSVPIQEAVSGSLRCIQLAASTVETLLKASVHSR